MQPAVKPPQHLYAGISTRLQHTTGTNTAAGSPAKARSAQDAQQPTTSNTVYTTLGSKSTQVSGQKGTPPSAPASETG